MRKIVLIYMCFPVFAVFAQTDLESHFNLCLEFGAPLEVVELFQPFRAHLDEDNGSVSYVVQEDNVILEGKPYSEYQIWYTVDKDLGLYQSSLIIRGRRQTLQTILTGYLRKFSELYGEPVYTYLENGSMLIFWYSEDTYTVKARLILDIVNSYRYVSITHCSPLPRHTYLLKTLYNQTIDDEEPVEPGIWTPVAPAEYLPVSDEPPTEHNEF